MRLRLTAPGQISREARWFRRNGRRIYRIREVARANALRPGHNTKTHDDPSVSLLSSFLPAQALSARSLSTLERAAAPSDGLLLRKPPRRRRPRGCRCFSHQRRPRREGRKSRLWWLPLRWIEWLNCCNRTWCKKARIRTGRVALYHCVGNLDNQRTPPRDIRRDSNPVPGSSYRERGCLPTGAQKSWASGRRDSRLQKEFPPVLCPPSDLDTTPAKELERCRATGSYQRRHQT